MNEQKTALEKLDFRARVSNLSFISPRRLCSDALRKHLSKQDRKRAAAAGRAEVTRELEALALAAERRAVEVQRMAVEAAAEHARQEFTKRDTLYDELKRHCDFCTKVRGECAAA